MIGESEPAAKGQSLTDQLAVTPKSEPHRFTLSWTHYVFLMGIKNPEERRFYEIEAAAQNWTVRELRRQFDSSLYERLAFSAGSGMRPVLAVAKGDSPARR